MFAKNDPNHSRTTAAKPERLENLQIEDEEDVTNMPCVK